MYPKIATGQTTHRSSGNCSFYKHLQRTSTFFKETALRLVKSTINDFKMAQQALTTEEVPCHREPLVIVNPIKPKHRQDFVGSANLLFGEFTFPATEEMTLVPHGGSAQKIRAGLFRHSILDLLPGIGFLQIIEKSATLFFRLDQQVFIKHATGFVTSELR